MLPSTAPPSGAALKGSTVYIRELAPLYADLVGHDVPVQPLYDFASITAKYGGDG